MLFLQLLHRDTLDVSVITVHSFRIGLREMPGIEDVHCAQFQRERRPTKITDRDRVRGRIDTVLTCAELINLTQQRAPLFQGNVQELARS